MIIMMYVWFTMGCQITMGPKMGCKGVSVLLLKLSRVAHAYISFEVLL